MLPTSHITYIFRTENFKISPLLFSYLYTNVLALLVGVPLPQLLLEHLSMHLTAAEHKNSTRHSELTWSGSLQISTSESSENLQDNVAYLFPMSNEYLETLLFRCNITQNYQAVVSSFTACFFFYLVPILFICLN